MTMRRGVMGVLALVVLVGLAVTPTRAEEEQPVDYSDHAIVKIVVEDFALLNELREIANPLSCRPTLGEEVVVVDRQTLAKLRERGLQIEMIEENAQHWVDRSTAANEAARARRGAGFYDAYRTYQEISDHLDAIVAASPGIASRVSIGTSAGDEPLAIPGRDIFAIVVTGPSMPGDPEKPIVVVNGCQHAREWISPTSVTYCCEQFITQYGVDPRITDILDTIEIHFIPIVNPNGYEYTHTTDRFWRKNRTNNAQDVGTDLNRNWPTGWNNGQSTSTSGFNDLYVGTAPLSEAETSAVATYLETLAGTPQCLDGCGTGCCPIGESTSRIKGHLDVHSFSQVILGPWSFTDAFPPPRAEELTIVQDAMSAAMTSASGAVYPGALGDMPILAPAGGVMPDWTFAELGALSWTIEMRPSSGGLDGFDLPVDQIDEANAELLAGVIELAEHAGKRLGIQANPALPTTEADAPVDVSATITEFNGFDLAAGSAVVRSRLGTSGMFGATTLTFDTDSYNATITGPGCDETLQYYFEAMADDGTVVTLPADAPATVFETVGAEVTVTFDDDFQTGMGWSVNPDGTDTASTGQWQRVDPNGTAAAPEDDFSDDGTGCYVTENGAAGGALGAADVDGGQTTLLSPIFDLSGANGAVVSYARWYSNSAGSAPNGDTFLIEITDDDGANWTSLETVGPAGAGTSGGWIPVSFNVQDFVGLTSQVRVRFVASDFGSGSIVEAGVDEFLVQTIENCTPVNDCFYDVNGTGTVDIVDFTAFAASFDSMTGDANYDPALDFNDTGSIDIVDFTQFAAEFNRADCLG